MEEIITTETIINYLEEKIKHREPVAPSTFVDAAQKLNVLLSDEHAELYRLQQILNEKKAELIGQGESVAKAKTLTEATEDFHAYCLQKAYIERIEEFIRIAKLQARMKIEELKGY